MGDGTWCVWAAIPFPKGSDVGWSRVAGDMTEAAADLFSSQLHFRTRVMLDAGPDHRYPVMSIARELCTERHPGTVTSTGLPCNKCVDASRSVRDQPAHGCLSNLASGLCNGRRFAHQGAHGEMTGPPCESCIAEAETTLIKRRTER